jgi:hypothetical protein
MAKWTSLGDNTELFWAVLPQLPPPTDVKSSRSFLGHARFYRRFIKDFSTIIKPLTHLLQKDVGFEFDEKCLAALRTLKSTLLSALIIQPPDWSQSFEIMCDASDYIVGAVLSHLIFRRKPNASHMCARIKFTHI